MMFELEADIGSLRFYAPNERAVPAFTHALDSPIGEGCPSVAVVQHDPAQGRIQTEFYCTRFAGHAGEHEAAGTFLGETFIMASWEN